MADGVLGTARAAQDDPVSRYMVALRAWHGSDSIQDAARTIGMSAREYCDRYVQANFRPLSWVSTGTSESIVPDTAYIKAFERVCAVEGGVSGT